MARVTKPPVKRTIRKTLTAVVKSTKSSSKSPTPYQVTVYHALLQIPSGRVTTYAALSAYLSSSPRAVGGALRRNPYAPHVPCHRVIASTGFVGGFMGDWEKAPSGINQNRKLGLLKDEGVFFDSEGRMKDKRVLWDEFITNGDLKDYEKIIEGYKMGELKGLEG